MFGVLLPPIPAESAADVPLIIQHTVCSSFSGFGYKMYSLTFPPLRCSHSQPTQAVVESKPRGGGMMMILPFARCGIVRGLSLPYYFV